MLVVGLIVGPAIGLLGGDFLFRSQNIGRPWNVLVFALFSIALLFTPFFDLGLRAGIVIGMVMGLLLTLTPAGEYTVGREM